MVNNSTSCRFLTQPASLNCYVWRLHLAEIQGLAPLVSCYSHNQSRTHQGLVQGKQLAGAGSRGSKVRFDPFCRSFVKWPLSFACQLARWSGLLNESTTWISAWRRSSTTRAFKAIILCFAVADFVHMKADLHSPGSAFNQKGPLLWKQSSCWTASLDCNEGNLRAANSFSNKVLVLSFVHSMTKSVHCL